MNNNSIYNKTHTTRQWNLYAILKEAYNTNQTQYLKLKNVYEEMRYRYEGELETYPYLKPNTSWNNQTARRQLTDDIEALKNSDIIQHIVISNASGVKLATADEVKDELEKEKNSLLKSLKRVYHQLDKASLDKQTRLVFNREKSIIDAFSVSGGEVNG